MIGKNHGKSQVVVSVSGIFLEDKKIKPWNKPPALKAHNERWTPTYHFFVTSLNKFFPWGQTWHVKNQSLRAEKSLFWPLRVKIWPKTDNYEMKLLFCVCFVFFSIKNIIGSCSFGFRAQKSLGTRVKFP